jgi:hypothetical protein
VTNCFRDHWAGRVGQQSALRAGERPNDLAVPVHANLEPRVGHLERFLAQEHWTWTVTPLALPDILRPLLGKTRYEPEV